MTPAHHPLATRERRRDLLALLVDHHPWLADDDLGPAAVDAGPCDRCGRDPRLVPPCGPVPWRGLCRDCVLEVGTAAFCAGHADEADDLLARARALPATWATLVRLAWVARGEVRADRDFLAAAAATLRTSPAVADLLVEPPGGASTP